MNTARRKKLEVPWGILGVKNFLSPHNRIYLNDGENVVKSDKQFVRNAGNGYYGPRKCTNTEYMILCGILVHTR